MSHRTMAEPHSLPGRRDRLESTSTRENRHSDGRSGCLFKCYYTTIEDEKRHLEGGETWLLAKTVDLSARGIALITRRPYRPGTIVVIVPLVSGWNQEREVLARVTNLHQETDQGWHVGCDLVRLLAQFELE